MVKNGKFRVYISLMGKRYHLGYYGTYEQAVQARLDAENQLHTGFVEQYRKWAAYAAVHPDWSTEHPFTYEVRQIYPTRFQIFCPEIPGGAGLG